MYFNINYRDKLPKLITEGVLKNTTEPSGNRM